MKFRYYKLPLRNQSDFFGYSILKPIIPIGLTMRGKLFDYAALIDSGADFCIFDAGIGEALDIDVKSGRKITFSGIQDAGGAQAYVHEVTIVIGGWEHKTMVGFSYDIASDGYGILGQKGFFDLFIVKFDFLKEEVELTPREGRF